MVLLRAHHPPTRDVAPLQAPKREPDPVLRTSPGATRGVGGWAERSTLGGGENRTRPTAPWRNLGAFLCGEKAWPFWPWLGKKAVHCLTRNILQHSGGQDRSPV